MAFGALLVYAPQGSSALSQQSKQITRHIKNCRAPLLERIGRRFHELHSQGMFREFFGPRTTLVAEPRSTPSVKDMLWPALRVCDELAERGLCGDVARLLQRRTPVRKSATSQATERPSPEQHFASLRCIRSLTAPERITIVDDVVTRGSTLLGCAWALAEQFPGVPVRAIAIVRTMSRQEIEQMLDPVDDGCIRLVAGQLHREP